MPVAGQPYEYPLDLAEVERRLADTGLRVFDVEVFRLTADTRVAYFDRLMPGEGGLDLAGLLRALPAGLPLSLEIPYAKPLPALQRARRARDATLRLLEQCALPS